MLYQWEIKSVLIIIIILLICILNPTHFKGRIAIRTKEKSKSKVDVNTKLVRLPTAAMVWTGGIKKKSCLTYAYLTYIPLM